MTRIVNKSYKHITVTTDGDGTTNTQEKVFTTKIVVENFIMLFTNNLNKLNGITSITDLKVLLLLTTKCEFNSNKVSISPEDRVEIQDTLGIGVKTFNNSISRLRTANLITGKRGFYQIDPHLLWKGTSDGRKKMIKQSKEDQ